MSVKYIEIAVLLQLKLPNRMYNPNASVTLGGRFSQFPRNLAPDFTHYIREAMNRSSIVLLAILICVSSVHAQHKPKPTPCPGITEISDCPPEGCGKGADADLNSAKNIRVSDGTTPTLKTVQWWKELKNPRGRDCRNREKLRELGEGQMITVVAWALAARAEGQETCNCKLAEPKDTDNHIVLVDPKFKRADVKEK
jgi:hypothetical protein